ncbi:hypothetical protein HYPSUDRAFT_300292 [Hypholoma sublateritium FD-334 SS-4]|uniref:Uncharacterized protein n=1 Tax=Hypholoma sublateritium (strain FD-334 SS-4) TaxID=945553 RepID=A0A0D2P795_HYPSF|nr:hypothetical protein HYPSUDRAFT_300292 [Hypholoma sublateritium FD-334 SS-4]
MHSFPPPAAAAPPPSHSPCFSDRLHSTAASGPHQQAAHTRARPTPRNSSNEVENPTLGMPPAHNRSQRATARHLSSLGSCTLPRATAPSTGRAPAANTGRKYHGNLRNQMACSGSGKPASVRPASPAGWGGRCCAGPSWDQAPARAHHVRIVNDIAPRAPLNLSLIPSSDIFEQDLCHWSTRCSHVSINFNIYIFARIQALD